MAEEVSKRIDARIYLAELRAANIKRFKEHASRIRGKTQPRSPGLNPDFIFPDELDFFRESE